MNPMVRSVRALPDHLLRLSFDNGEVRVFDLKPYLDRGVFRALQDPVLFGKVQVVAGSIEWPGEIDLSHDTLFVRSQIMSAEAV
jgi:hypothetical protein